MKKRFWLISLMLVMVLALNSCATVVTNDRREKDRDKAETTKDKKDNEREMELRRWAKYADMTAMFQWMNMWPDGTETENSDWAMQKYNRFAVFDVDNDGIEELILSYQAGSMAAMMEMIVEYDPENDEIHEEAVLLPGGEFYDNGYVLVPLSHNQSGSETWPYYVLEYDEKTDTYEEVENADSSDEEFTKGDILEIPYQEIVYENLQEATEMYLDFMTEKLAEEYDLGESDIGLQYMKPDMDLEEIAEFLADEYDVELQEDEEQEGIVGMAEGEAVFYLTYFSGGWISYQDTKVEDVTVLGIYPGMKMTKAEKIMETAGFYQSDENLYISGDNGGNYSVWLEEEGGKVQSITIAEYCSFAG